MKRTKLEKGITLIALIITIVVLLILAVVTIGAIQESKIIAHAKNASTSYNDEKVKEESAIGGYEALIESKLPGGNEGGSNVTYKEGIPVPSGFYYVTGTKDTGFVISDNPADENNASGKNGNQFVWVPVTTDIDEKGYGLGTSDYREPDVIIGSGSTFDAVSDNLTRSECAENPEDSDEVLTTDDFKAQLTKEYKLMAESINKYDGFYVGRYEVSFNESRKAQSKGSTEEVSVYSAINSTTSTNGNNATDWYGLYALCKTYNTTSVKSSMIWGIQYNKMMDWIGGTADTNIGDARNTDIQRRTGYISTDVIKNVYDLYGNSFEWTLEAVNIGARVNRGGSYTDNYEPSRRYSSSSSGTPLTNNGINGSRLAICITP